MKVSDEIYNLAKKAGISEGKLNEEFMFTIQSVNLFYYSNNIGENDIRECFVDGSNDGGIDYICTKDDEMHLIQGKSTEKLSYDEIRNLFLKMNETVNNFEKSKYSIYSKKLQSTFLNVYDSLPENNRNINLVLFTNTRLSEDIKTKVKDLKNDVSLINYTLYDTLNLYENKQYLKYSDNGIIVNITAESLKRLYIKQKNNGLFSYNLREHISQKNVDNAIDYTIRNDKENFWYYNNGITIGCGDYIVDGNKLKLWDFSIINGAQTTTKVGESKIINPEYDFAIVCKIVKAKKDLNAESDFIMKISEASNSQKPIRPRDLKANSREQKTMQDRASKNEYPLAIEIKRGKKAPNYNSSKIQAWQRVNNEYIGQLIMACILQKPGTARSNKASLFIVEKTYNDVYRQDHDYNVLYELVNIANLYEEFKKSYMKENTDTDDMAICTNGKFTVLAVVFYLYKFYAKIVDSSSDENLEKYNIKNTRLTLDYKDDDYEQKMMILFNFIVNRLRILYDSNKDRLKLTSCSNFFKTDSNYQDVILKAFDKMLIGTFSIFEKENIDKCMTIFGF